MDTDDLDLLCTELHQIRAADIERYRTAVPPGALEMIDVLGTELSLKLFRYFPGGRFFVPHGEHAPGQRKLGSFTLERLRRCREITPDDIAALCSAWGGELLHIPVFRDLLKAKRAAWIRGVFDLLVMHHQCSRAEAIYQIGRLMHQIGLTMTARTIDSVLDKPDEDDDSQAELFHINFN